jgi:hypothetical protein
MMPAVEDIRKVDKIFLEKNHKIYLLMILKGTIMEFDLTESTLDGVGSDKSDDKDLRFC